MACFRLLTLPPFPLFPDLSVPVFFRCIALFTDFPAARPYLAIVSSYPNLTGIAGMLVNFEDNYLNPIKERNAIKGLP